MTGSYVTSQDHSLYSQFCNKLLHELLRPAPPVVWHYTTGEGLIGILQSGAIYATQVSCLNDHTEFRYANGLLRDALNAKRSENPSSDILWLLDHIEAGMAVDGASTNHWFVACFSSERDDLSQWRAYSGGENGYAIGFSTEALVKCGFPDHNLLVPVNYNRATHRRIAEQVAQATISFFLDGLLAARAPTRDIWAEHFLTEWSRHITYFGPIAKDPAFDSEREWRIVHALTESDRPLMEYRQKRTLMSRHVPLRFPPTKNPEKKLLPIAEILIGPSRHKETSKISVGDLLLTLGYPDDQRKVEISVIPYQAI